MPKSSQKSFRNLSTAGLILTIASACLLNPGTARSVTESSQILAGRMFDRLTGIPLSTKDPRRSQMTALIEKGDLKGAAQVATSDDSFYNLTLRHWASSLSDRNEDSHSGLNDFVAMVIGTVRDSRDFREILSGNFTYIGPKKVGNVEIPLPNFGNSQHYEFLELLHVNLRSALTRREPQNPEFSDPAGVLTSQAWGYAHFNMGTNRRAVEYTFREFLCTPIEQMRDASMPEDRIHRDVDRKPGGNSQTYLSTCRSCHGGLDALVGAFAYFNYGFSGNALQVTQSAKIQRKMNQNGDVYPDGYITTDNSWFNNYTRGQNAALGWRGSLSGRGIREFGVMVANSEGFSRCMAKRVFTEICHRDALPEESTVISDLGKRFEANGYDLKSLFEEAASQRRCL